MAKRGKDAVAASPTLMVYISGQCYNCREALRLAREIEASYADLVVQVVNLDVVEAPEDSEVFAVPTYFLNEEMICLGNPAQSWLQQQINDLISTMQA